MAHWNQDGDREEFDRERNHRGGGDRDVDRDRERQGDRDGYYGGSKHDDREHDHDGFYSGHRDLDHYERGRGRPPSEINRSNYDYTSGGRARDWDRGRDDWGGYPRGRR